MVMAITFIVCGLQVHYYIIHAAASFIDFAANSWLLLVSTYTAEIFPLVYDRQLREE